MTDTTSATSYSQNPFCDRCFAERMDRANKQFGPRIRKRAGKYFESIRASETHVPDDDDPDDHS